MVKRLQQRILALCVIGLVSLAVNGEVVQFEPCRDSDSSICEIKELRVTPCKEAAASRPKPCKLRRGSNATIEFDYVLDFDSENLIGQAYSSSLIGLVNLDLDLPLVGMERNACKSTICPVKAGETQKYSFDLPLASYFPPSGYTVKWRLWDKDDDKLGCCMTFKIRLV